MEEIILDGNMNIGCGLEDKVVCPTLNGVSAWNISEPIVEIRLLEGQEKAEEGYRNS